MLLICPSPSTTTRFSIGAWANAGSQHARNNARRRTEASTGHCSALCGKDHVRGPCDTAHSVVRLVRRLTLGPVAIHQDGPNTRVGPAIDIAPAVANHKTARQIDVMLLRGIQDQARLRFPAMTLVAIVVPADA